MDITSVKNKLNLVLKYFKDLVSTLGNYNIKNIKLKGIPSALGKVKIETGNVLFINGMSCRMWDFFSNPDISIDWSNSRLGTITNLSHCFDNAYFYTRVLDVSDVDMTNVEDASYMFYECKAQLIKGLKSFRFNNLKNINYMLYNISARGGGAYQCYVEENGNQILDVSMWDTSKVTTMNAVFKCDFGFKNIKFHADNEEDTLWNVSNVTTLDTFIYGVDTFDAHGWDTSKLTSCKSFAINVNHLILTGWDFSNIAKYTTNNANWNDKFGMLFSNHQTIFSNTKTIKGPIKGVGNYAGNKNIPNVDICALSSIDLESALVIIDGLVDKTGESGTHTFIVHDNVWNLLLDENTGTIKYEVLKTLEDKNWGITHRKTMY